MKRLLIFSLLALLLVSCFFTVSAASNVKVETGNYLELKADFYLPEVKGDTKVPVVFLSHNGGSVREKWGDYPQQLAEQGWLVVNFDWNTYAFKTNLEAESVIQYTFQKYASIADPKRVALVGGCRGGGNLVAELTRLKKLPCTVKTMVVLSISEDNTYTDMMKGLKAEHPPILAYYTLRDRLGTSYQAISKQFAEELLTQPKTVVALDATPHGQELVVDPSTKDQVRKDIIEWLKKYLAL